MRVLAIAGMSLALFGLGMGMAEAAPVDLVCKSSASEVHMSIDVEAAKVVWADQTFDATVTDTQVSWTGIAPVGNSSNGPTLYGSFDRDTGTLIINEDAGSDPTTGIRWGSYHGTWSCTKAQKIL